ncbi:MAG: hypothetical protein N3A66_03525, partial [Planctomycetota bacterium]|nr:hypothetical protein [Planctomycetota bacterium]
CGLGWCYGHLRRWASAEQRQRFLRLGRAALADALAALPADDERRGSLAYLLAEIALEESEPAEAERLARSLLGEPAWRFQAAYLRSQALRQQGKPAAAAAQLQALLRWPPATASDNQMRQQALRSLGEIALAAEDNAAAYLWYKRAAAEARLWRDEAAIADADLGAAKALIALAQGAAVKSPPAAKLISAHLVLALGCADAVEMLNFRMEAWQRARAAGPADLDAALALLERLTKRYAAHIRHDEIAYWRGQALLSQADAARAAGRREEEVVGRYKNAAEAFAPAAYGNPLSPWALAAGLLMAEAQQRQARYLFDLADKWQQQNAQTEAQIRIAAGKQALAAALQTLGQCLKLPGTAAQQARARQLRGEVYFDLEEFDKAAEEFEGLARQSDLGLAWQCQAARQWSAALARQGKKEEAVQTLLPYIRESAQAAIQAGLLWEALERWPKAYEAYQSSLLVKADEMTRAEGRYRLAALTLQHAEELQPQESAAMQRRALRDLEEIAAGHPRTPWAVEALLTAGEWYLARGAREALRLAMKAANDYGDYPALKQAAKFLEGAALLGQEKPREALPAFQEAEAVAANHNRSRELRAKAIRGQGDALLRLGERQAAMRHYGRALADYAEVDEVADQCRVALAKCLAEEGKTAEAWRLLEAGKNRGLMQQTREEIQKSAPAAGENKR